MISENPAMPQFVRRTLSLEIIGARALRGDSLQHLVEQLA